MLTFVIELLNGDRKIYICPFETWGTPLKIEKAVEFSNTNIYSF